VTKPITLSFYEACVYTGLDPYLLRILLTDFRLPDRGITVDQLDNLLRFLNANILGDPVIFRLWAEAGFTPYNPPDRAGRSPPRHLQLDSHTDPVDSIPADS